MPMMLVEAYQAAMADPDLISARDNIAICESRIDQLFTRLDEEPENGVLWVSIRKWIGEARKLRDTERRRLEAAQAYITTEKLLGLVSTLGEILRSEIRDEGLLRRLLIRVQAQVGDTPLPEGETPASDRRALPSGLTRQGEPTS
jgi:hypothetical protein